MTDTTVTTDIESSATQLAALVNRVESQDEALLEKDEIIAALTDRLEMAAEQLDRVKRSGADRGPRGVPAELVAHQEETQKDIRALVTQFEGVDVAQSFGRLEMLLGEVRELVLNQQDLFTGTDPGGSDDPKPAPKPDLLGGWDSIKNQLLGDNAPADAVGASDTPAVDEPTNVSLSETAAVSETATVTEDVETGDREPNDLEVVTRPPAFEPPPVEPLPAELPEPVDLDEADRDTLVAALEVRDRYISMLTRRVEDRRSKLTVPTDWDSLAAAPDDLVEAVQRLHDELNDAVRTAEVDICLERAKLSREKTKLEQLKMSLGVSDEENVPTSESDDPADKSQRWKRMLGISGD